MRRDGDGLRGEDLDVILLAPLVTDPQSVMYWTVVGVAWTGWIVTVKSAGVPGLTSPSTMVESPIEITGADAAKA